jgi:site-specific recombinase XerD
MAWDQPTDLARSFERHLRAENKSPGTVSNYLEAIKQLTVFLAAGDRPVTQARREDLEAFLASLLERWTAGTVVTRYRALRVFYGWLTEEGEISRNPMTRMKPPAATERPVPVVSDEELRRLLAALCRQQLRLQARHGDPDAHDRFWGPQSRDCRASRR